MTGRAAAAIATATLLAWAGIAFAEGGPRQTASFELTQDKPGRSTSERLMFDYVNPADPEAKPPAVRRVVTVLPRGARFDVSVPDSCGVADADLILHGASACPQGSVVGGGIVTVDTGGPPPTRFVTIDVAFINNASDPDGELIYLNTVRGSEVRTVIRTDAAPRRGTADLGMLPGAPPEGGAIDTVDVSLDAITRTIDGERRNYITTPKRCRGRKDDPHWTTRVEFTYADGVTETVRTPSPCRNPKTGDQPVATTPTREAK